MIQESLSVREIEEKDIGLLADYWFLADEDFLIRIGVDLKKMPGREGFERMLKQQIVTPYSNKAAYALIWEVDKIPVGHSNINNITYGKEAYMHLHLWNFRFREKGIGTRLLKMSLPFYFNNFNLEQLISEPRAINIAPNRTLEKAGFEFEKTYVTIPGSINYEQEVSRWCMTRFRFKELSNNP